MNKKYLVISALGHDRTGIVNELSKLILDNSGNIEDSRMTVLGGEFASMTLVSGTWNAIAKIENLLPGLEKKLGLTVVAKHTEPRKSEKNLVPYLVDVVSIDHPGIVHEVADFFAAQGINIEDLSTSTYAAAHTGTPMFAMNVTIAIPGDVHIGQLRHAFQNFCDDLNLDATIEPVRA